MFEVSGLWVWGLGFKVLGLGIWGLTRLGVGLGLAMLTKAGQRGFLQYGVYSKLQKSWNILIPLPQKGVLHFLEFSVGGFGSLV